jgi:hypothetical protein
MENGMLVERHGRGAKRDRFFFTFQGFVFALMLLVTAVSCTTPGFDGREPLFSLPVFDAPNQQSAQRDEGQSKDRRVQSKSSTTPKVAKANEPKAKKANTPAQVGDQKEWPLYQEFLEWRKGQKDQP